MRKRLSYILCVLTLLFTIAGCSGQKNIEYNEAALIQACDNMFTLISSGQIPAEEIAGMSDWNQGYLMAQVEGQTGVRISADNFVTALQGWDASAEECGTYEGHGDYEIKTSSTGVTVTTEAEFSKRTADLIFSFDKNLELDAFTVSAHFGFSEILTKAGLNTLLGMGTVFAVLIFMCFVISLFKYIPMLVNKKKEEKAEQPEVKNTVAEATEEVDLDETELVAVIAAAIAAYEGTTTDDFVVRSIKRRKSNKWNA